MISQEEQEKVINQLSQRIPNLKCPMCGNDHFIVADGYFNHFMQDKLSGVSIGGPSIPVIPIICNKCGFVSQHAVGILGLLHNNSNNKFEGGDHEKQ